MNCWQTMSNENTNIDWASVIFQTSFVYSYSIFSIFEFFSLVYLSYSTIIFSYLLSINYLRSLKTCKRFFPLSMIVGWNMNFCGYILFFMPGWCSRVLYCIDLIRDAVSSFHLNLSCQYNNPDLVQA